MPHYDYVCTVCGTRVEVIHGVHATGPPVCTECGGTMRKALTSPTFVFKGSGWAKKDRVGSRSGAGGSTKGEQSGGEGSAGEAPKATDSTAKKDGHGAGAGTPAD